MSYEIRDMEEVMDEILKAEGMEEFDYEESMVEPESNKVMYVLSNEKRIEGAVCMIYPGLLRDFADKIGSSFYIIPSSVHEILLLPSENPEDREELKSMIKEINDTQMEAGEILSYSLYWFDKDKSEICIL